MEIHNCLQEKQYTMDHNFIQINYTELLNRGYFLAKNHVAVKIISDASIGNFSLVQMDKISINILLTHLENINLVEYNYNNNKNIEMMGSNIRKRNHSNGYSKFVKRKK